MSLRIRNIIPTLALLLFPLGGWAAEPIFGIPPGEAPQAVFAASEVPLDELPWWADKVSAKQQWAKGATGKGIKVAIVDTGVNINHPRFKGRKITAVDFSRSPSGSHDPNGHGTHVADIVATISPECELYCLKALSDQGSGSDSWIGSAIDYGVKEGCRVVNLSLGSKQPGPSTGAAIQRAIAKGVVIVAAAGNEGPGQNTVGYPASFPGVIAVGAVDANDAVARFSSRGPRVDVASYGVGIRAAYREGFATLDGTSMACPSESGIISNHLSVKPDAKPEDILALVRSTAKDLPPAGRDTASGYGLTQPMKMLELVSVPQPMPGPTPRTILLGWDDLTDGAKGRLRAAGVDALKLELVIKP